MDLAVQLRETCFSVTLAVAPDVSARVRRCSQSGSYAAIIVCLSGQERIEDFGGTWPAYGRTIFVVDGGAGGTAAMESVRTLGGAVIERDSDRSRSRALSLAASTDGRVGRGRPATR